MKKKMKGMSPLMWILFSILILYAVSIFLLLFWGLMTSFKSLNEFDDNKVWLPGENGWAFGNYATVFEYFYVPISSSTLGKVNIYIEELLLNTILYAGGGALVLAFVPCFVAYLTAKYKCKFSSIIYWVVILTMALPIVGADASMIEFMQRSNLYDNFYGNWIQKCNFLGMYFLVYYAIFEGIPNDYREAAMIDGAGEISICFRVYFPLVLKSFFMVFLIKFMELWNDYQTVLLYLPTHPTLAVGVFSLTNSKIGELQGVPIRMATCFIVLVPILALFIAFKDKLMGNVSMGGIKG